MSNTNDQRAQELTARAAADRAEAQRLRATLPELALAAEDDPKRQKDLDAAQRKAEELDRSAQRADLAAIAASKKAADEQRRAVERRKQELSRIAKKAEDRTLDAAGAFDEALLALEVAFNEYLEAQESERAALAGAGLLVGNTDVHRGRANLFAAMWASAPTLTQALNVERVRNDRRLSLGESIVKRVKSWANLEAA